jgi:hypothetical protein
LDITINMNISPEPAACPLPDQQAEHDYQNDPGDITMANDHLNGDSGQGLMGESDFISTFDFYYLC